MVAGLPAETRDGGSLLYQRRIPAGWSLRQLNLATGVDREILPAMVERAFGIARDGVYYIPIPGADGRFTTMMPFWKSTRHPA
jgi:hypothetical protein